MFIFADIYAADDLSVNYHDSSKAARISGYIGEVNELVAISILPENVQLLSLTDSIINENKYVVTLAYTDDSGNISLSLTIPDYYKSGKYIVYAAYGDNVKNGSFLHSNSDEAQIIINELNSAKQEEYGTIISNNALVLGIDKVLYEAYAENANEYLCKNRPLSGYTAGNFTTELKKFLAIKLIADGKLSEAMDRFASLFGVNGEDIAALPDAVKVKLAEGVQASDIINKPADEVFMQSLIFANISVKENYVDFRAEILANSKYIGLDMTKYNSLSSYKQSEVFSKMFDAKPGSLSQIASLFEEYVGLYSSAGSSTGSGGGNGSGGGFGGMGDFRIDTKQSDSKNSDIYSDMAQHWSCEAVYALSEQGIVNGFPDGTFKPEESVSRAEFIKMLMSAAGEASAESSCTFDDVTENDWFFDYVAAAKEMGIAVGFDNKFNPNGILSREDASVMLYRTMKTKNAELAGAQSFNDDGEISEYAKEAVSALCANGITKGYDGRFSPKAKLTRAEAATLIYRMIDYLKGI